MQVRPINYRKNKHQKIFHRDITSKRLHLSTGFGGGKSYALVMKMLRLSHQNVDVHGGLMCPTLVDFKKDMLPLFEEILDDNMIPYIYNASAYTFKFPWTKGKLYIVSAEKKIRGPNWGYAGINELTLCPLVRYKEVIGRVRVKKARYPQIASVGTPEGLASEYYEYMIENPGDKFTIIYGDTRDNQMNLNDDYVQNLLDSYDKVMIDAYLKGMWVNMVGNRFYYAYDPDVNDDSEIRQKEDQHIHIAIDFNVEYMTATMWNYDGRSLTAFDEMVIPDNASTERMAQAFIARGYHPEFCTLYPDTAGKARKTDGRPDHKVLRDNGFTDLVFRSAAPRFRQRQLHMNNLLDKAIIRINPVKCPTLKKDFMAVEQDKVDFSKIKKNPKLTHASDGVDYMTDILIPFKGRRKASSSQRIR